MEIVNYLANGMGLAMALYHAGFYNFNPRGLMPYLSAKYGVEFPGFN